MSDLNKLSKLLATVQQNVPFSIDDIIVLGKRGDIFIFYYYSKEKEEYIVHNLYEDSNGNGCLENGSYYKSSAFAADEFARRLMLKIKM